MAGRCSPLSCAIEEKERFISSLIGLLDINSLIHVDYRASKFGGLHPISIERMPSYFQSGMHISIKLRPGLRASEGTRSCVTFGFTPGRHAMCTLRGALRRLDL